MVINVQQATGLVRAADSPHPMLAEARGFQSSTPARPYRLTNKDDDCWIGVMTESNDFDVRFACRSPLLVGRF